MNTKVKWYRNASEKDHDNVKGRGELMAIMPMQNNAGGTAVIADDDGNIVEKELSLIKIDKGPQVNTEALADELNKTIEANGKLSDDLNALQEELDQIVESNGKDVASYGSEIKTLKAQLVTANNAKTAALKQVKDLKLDKK